MKPHALLDGEARDRAALHVFGGMERSESRIYEAHLAQCAVCREEVEALRGVARTLLHSAPEAEPPARLRRRVLERARSVGASPGGLTLVRADEAGWRAAGVAGVEIRPLLVDEGRDRQTVLVRMAPGASFPTHRHAGREECYVIEGDLRDGKLRMKAGDYSCFEGGSQHGPLSTDKGCLLLVISSLHDQIVEAPHSI
jgi:anti-sigma factor ChrR (cupin superfamily)